MALNFTSQDTEMPPIVEFPTEILVYIFIGSAETHADYFLWIYTSVFNDQVYSRKVDQILPEVYAFLEYIFIYVFMENKISLFDDQVSTEVIFYQYLMIKSVQEKTRSYLRYPDCVEYTFMYIYIYIYTFIYITLALISRWLLIWAQDCIMYQFVNILASNCKCIVFKMCDSNRYSCININMQNMISVFNDQSHSKKFCPSLPKVTFDISSIEYPINFRCIYVYL